MVGFRKKSSKSARPPSPTAAAPAPSPVVSATEAAAINKLIRDTNGGEDTTFLQHRRRSFVRAEDMPAAGSRFAERKLSPAAVEARLINERVKAKAVVFDAPAPTQEPRASESQFPPRRQRRMTTGDLPDFKPSDDLVDLLRPPGRDELRAKSTFAKDRPKDSDLSGIVAEVNRRLQDKREKESLVRMEKEEEARVTAAYEMEDGGSKAKAAVAKGRAKAAAKAAAGVFIERGEYDELQAQLKQLKAEKKQHDYEMRRLQLAMQDMEAQSRRSNDSGTEGNDNSPSHKRSSPGSFIKNRASKGRRNSFTGDFIADSLKGLSPNFFRTNASKSKSPEGARNPATLPVRAVPNRTSSSYWNGVDESAQDVSSEEAAQREALRMTRWDTPISDVGGEVLATGDGAPKSKLW